MFTKQSLRGVGKSVPKHNRKTGSAWLSDCPALEALEQRLLLSAALDYRPVSEIGNNAANPLEGTSGTDLLRVSPAAYRVTAADPSGFSTPSMNGGSPFFVSGSRLVSNAVANQATELFGSTDTTTVNANGLSAFGYSFGQFLDHDMGLTPDNGTNDFNIPADPTHPEDSIGSLLFSRSVFDPNTGTTNPRQQINVNTSFLDLSNVYGSTDDVAHALRAFSGGRLKSSPGADGKIGTKDDLLPYNNTTYFTSAELTTLNIANDANLVDSSQLFAAGDVRVNETTELTSLQTLFMRNHNRIAKELQQDHPGWTDEHLYQEARKINIAQEQSIVYNEYLPALLGPGALPAYKGYKATVDPSLANEFSTIGFRFGHSLLNDVVLRHTNKGVDIADPTGSASVALAESFSDPNLLKPGGVVDPFTGHVSSDIGAVLKGDADTSAQALDVMAVSDIRDLLFGQGGPGQDLIARDVWRAHDHGIGTYNQVRVAYGLAPITDTPVTHGFEQITSDPAVQQLLLTAYTGPTRDAFLANGKFAGDIDPFMAGLAEDHAPGSAMGPLFTRILVDQFTRLRDGDSYFYRTESWTKEESSLLSKGDTLSEVIRANTTISNLPKNVFKFAASISGRVNLSKPNKIAAACTSGIGGITAQLIDAANGDVLATTVTDSAGRYTFNQLSGPAANPADRPGVSGTGSYKVILSLPAGYKQISRNPANILVDVSGENFSCINFVISQTA